MRGEPGVTCPVVKSVLGVDAGTDLDDHVARRSPQHQTRGAPHPLPAPSPLGDGGGVSPWPVPRPACWQPSRPVCLVQGRSSPLSGRTLGGLPALVVVLLRPRELVSKGDRMSRAS